MLNKIIAIGLSLAFVSFSSYAAETHKKPGEPLYWVDPSEPTVHYQAAGESKNGVKLIPVYKEKTEQAGMGTSPSKSNG